MASGPSGRGFGGLFHAAWDETDIYTTLLRQGSTIPTMGVASGVGSQITVTSCLNQVESVKAASGALQGGSDSDKVSLRNCSNM